VTRTGAHLVVEALAAAGVRHLFSLSGNQILSLYDATLGSGLSILHTRHEAAAVHMADAWGRLTEEPGVALVTAGPGHCNAISALYGALMAESPVVLLSGHAPTGQLGRGAFQEMDQAAVAAPVCKASWMAKDAARLGEDIATALELARSGRPGPVHVSLPGDLLEAKVAAGAGARAPRREAAMAASAAEVEQALALLAAARRPVILLGGAMARGPRRAAVARFSDATGVPALPMESPRGFNDPWLHLAAPLLGQADLLVLLGKKPDFVVRFAQAPAVAAGCRMIQVDADAASLRAGAALGIVADPAVVTDQLAAAARGRAWSHRAWGDEVARAGDGAGRVGGRAPVDADADPSAPGLRGDPAASRSRRDPDRRRRRVRPVGAGRARGGDPSDQWPRGLHRQRDPDGDLGQAASSRPPGDRGGGRRHLRVPRLRARYRGALPAAGGDGDR